MDITIQMRSIELLVKILRHDLDNVPSYGYTPQKPKTFSGPASHPLKRSTPEAEGVSSQRLLELFKGINESEEIAPHGLIALRHGKVIAEGYWAPYNAETPHMLYSMSKSIVGTAIGMAVDEGLLALSEKLVDIFGDVTPAPQSRLWRNATVENLLTMSTGARFNEIGTMLNKDWARMFMESLRKFEPGAAFEYNSLNSYMLAHIIKRKTGVGVVDFLQPRLFEPLGIGQYAWEKCPMGIEKGGWGLYMRLEDCAKIGQLYLNRGIWEGRRLLSEVWVEQAAAKRIDTPKGECKNGYGYQIWMSPIEGAYQFNGAFGQYVVVLPQNDAVVALFSGSAQLFAKGALTQMISRCFEGADQKPLSVSGETDKLNSYLEGLMFSPPLPDGDWGAEPCMFSRFMEDESCREYRMEENHAGLLPQTLQAAHSNYTSGTDLIRFEKLGRGLRISMYEGLEANSIFIRGDGGLSRGSFTHRGETYSIGVRGLWSSGPDGALSLLAIISFTETPDTRLICFELGGGALTARYDETPSVEAATDMLLELVGMSKVAYARQVIPHLGPSRFRELMRQFMAPEINGRLITRHEDTYPSLENQEVN